MLQFLCITWLSESKLLLQGTLCAHVTCLCQSLGIHLKKNKYKFLFAEFAFISSTLPEISGKVPTAFKQCESEKNELMYLCVLLVAPVDFGQALSSCFAGRRHCKSLLHFAGTITETPLDTIGFKKLIHLVGTRKVY